MATFRTVLEATSGKNVGIVVPEPIVLAFNRGKRVPVIVTIDGGYSYKTTIGVMGGRYLVSFNAETRKQTGRGAGDEVEVEWNCWQIPSAEGQLGPSCTERGKSGKREETACHDSRGGRCLLGSA